MRSRHTSWQRGGDRASALGTQPLLWASASSLGRKKIKKVQARLTSRWISWVHSVSPLSWLPVLFWSGPGDSTGHHGPCLNAGASDRKLGQGFVGDDSECAGQQALLRRSICSKGGHGIDILLQRSAVLLSIYSLLLGWRSHGPPLTSGLHSLDQAFAQDGKVLQDGFYIGHHHQLPTLRHHHASLCVGGLGESEKCRLRCHERHTQRHQNTRFTPATGSLVEPHTDTHAHVERMYTLRNRQLSPASSPLRAGAGSWWASRGRRSPFRHADRKSVV